MNRINNLSLLARILIPVIVFTLLGITPRPQKLTQNLWWTRRAIDSGSSPGNNLRAAKALAQVAEFTPWRVDLWETAGRYAFQGEDPGLAIRYLEKAASSESLSNDGQLMLGDVYVQAGDLETAVDIWQASALKHGASVDVYRRLLDAHRTQGDTQAVINDLEAIAQMQPADTEIRYQLGLLLAPQQPEAALQHLVQVVDQGAERSEAAAMIVSSIRTALLQDEPAYVILEAGRALAALEEWDLAAEAFQRATLIRPDYSEAWAFLGEAKQHLSEPPMDEALSDLEKALDLEPDSLTANTFLGLYWQRQGRLDLALEYLKHVVDLYPQNPAILTEMANTQAIQGDLDSAYQSYQRALGLAPREPTYYRQIVAFSLEHDYKIREVALPAARQAIMLYPEDAVSLDSMGQVLIRLEDLTSAERFLNRAVNITHSYAPAHLHLGLIYILQGDANRAVQKWSLVQSLAPNTPTAEQAKRLLQNYFP